MQKTNKTSYVGIYIRYFSCNNFIVTIKEKWHCVKQTFVRIVQKINFNNYLNNDV